MNSSIKTDFLFAQPSFASGSARLIDLWGTFDQYNISPTPAAADGRAIAADWQIIGQDMQSAISQYEIEVVEVNHDHNEVALSR